jgi:hypothetical protein
MLRTAGILSHRPAKIKCYDWLNSPGIEIPCDLLDWTVDQGGKRTARVRLHFHVEDQDGRTTFNVTEGTLIQHSLAPGPPRSGERASG